jgi:hypothetical protein
MLPSLHQLVRERHNALSAVSLLPTKRVGVIGECRTEVKQVVPVVKEL